MGGINSIHSLRPQITTGVSHININADVRMNLGWIEETQAKVLEIVLGENIRADIKSIKSLKNY